MPHATARLGARLLGGGLAGLLVWSLVVQSVLPSWFDPAEACARRFPTASFRVDIETWVLPPRATCTFGNERGIPVAHEYVPVVATVCLTVVFAVLTVLAVAGLAVLVRRLLWRDPAADAERAEPRTGWKSPAWRFGSHVAGVAMLGIIATGFGPLIFVFTGMLGGGPAAAVTVAAAVLGVVVAATALDVACGPGRSGRLGSRRRGTALGVLGSATVLGAIIAGDAAHATVSLGPSWPALAAAGVPFAVIASLQWIGTGRRRPDGP